MTEGYNSDFWFRWRDTTLRRQMQTARPEHEEVREIPLAQMGNRFVAHNHLTIGGERVAFPEWSEE